MGNLVALLTHCGRGDEIIVGAEAHIFHAEARAALGAGRHRLRTPCPTGPTARSTWTRWPRRSAGRRASTARTRLICIENTQNRCGGVPLPPGYMDGAAARWPAATTCRSTWTARASSTPPSPAASTAAELARDGDHGHVLPDQGAGRAGRLGAVRRRGLHRAAPASTARWSAAGMRQVGILAAAGHRRPDRMVDRLADDHANARRLAAGLAACPAWRWTWRACRPTWSTPASPPPAGPPTR